MIITGDFNEVSLGTGIIKWNAVDIGYLKGDVTVRHNYDVTDFEVGVPLILVGTVVKRIVFELVAPMAQLSVPNIAIALGGLTPVITDASPIVETMKPYVMAPYLPSGGMSAFKIGGVPPVTVETGTVTIKNANETETYTEHDDYIVDYTTGWIFRNPAGNIEHNQVLRVTNTHIPIANRQINLGSVFTLSKGSLEFIHESPITGKQKRVYMHNAQASTGVEIPFSEENFHIANITFKASYTASQTANPLGWIWEEI